jgi:hypothetical protein
MRNASFVLAVALFAAIPASARDRDHRELRVVPAVFDPGGTHAILSRWTPFSGPGRSDPAIIMAKILPTSADAAAVATVEGVRGLVLDELGFDVFLGGHCGAGAPRFNVTTVEGYVYFFGCAAGTHTPAPDKPATFARVRFADADAAPQFASNPPFHFGEARVASIAIVFDEGVDQGSGFTAIDDIDVDGQIVERPSGDGDDDEVRQTLERPIARR